MLALKLARHNPAVNVLVDDLAVHDFSKSQHGKHKRAKHSQSAAHGLYPLSIDLPKRIFITNAARGSRGN